MTSAHLTFDTTSSKCAKRVLEMRASSVRSLFAAATSSDIISLSGGMPDVSLLPASAVRKATRAATDDRWRASALQYGDTNGRMETRQVICDIMRDSGVRCKAKDLMLTTGAQEALDLIAKTYIDPGDIILTEGPTYLGALQAFSAYQPDVHCIPFDEDGMRMDSLEEELESIGKNNARLKFLYAIPNFQNPGGVTMSPERRHRLLELSQEYGFLVVEDDPYGRLRYDGGHVLPLRALSDDVIYLGTVSKVFAPGLRLGWIIAPSSVIAKVNLVKQGTDLCGSAFNQVIVEHYFTDTPWQRTLQKFVKTYKTRRDAMLAALEKYFPPEATWTRPKGGFFVWVTLPEYVDTSSLLAEALESGVTFSPGDGFFPDGIRGKNCMRIAFCFESPENIEEAIIRLAKVIEERLELYRIFIEAGAIKVADERLAADGREDEKAVCGRSSDCADVDCADADTDTEVSDSISKG